MGAHPDPDAALLHALLEAVERDQLWRTLPDGWTAEAVMSRRLTEPGLKARAPTAAGWMEKLTSRGFQVGLFDLTPDPGTPGALGLPVAGALLVDAESGPIPLTAGYACRLDRDGALTSALLEAAQSRVTDIHGARDDVAQAEESGVDFLRGLLLSTAGVRDASRMPKDLRQRSPAEGVRQVTLRLQRAGFEEAAAVSLAPPGAPLHVFKAVVPGLRISELLL
jgi:ribosomal protein S12 methylthiotransferase accessory factor